MQNTETAGRNVLIQTTLRVAEGEDDELIVVSDRGCQTVTTISPDVPNSQIIPLLEYTPYSEIANNSLKVYDLPKKNQIQFELSEQRKPDKRRSSDMTSKGALKKSSGSDNPVVDPAENEEGEKSDTGEKGEKEDEKDEEAKQNGENDEGGSQSLNLSTDTTATKKGKQDVEIQTELSVVPPVLDDDAVANVQTQLGVQTSLTFDPDESLSKITPLLTKYMSHTKQCQAIYIDGKLVNPDGTEKTPKKDVDQEGGETTKPTENPEATGEATEQQAEEEIKPTTQEEKPDEKEKEQEQEPKEKEEGQEPKEKEEGQEPKEKEEGQEPAETLDTTETKPENKAVDSEGKKESQEVPAYKLNMTEEEFEKNVQRILENTVKNVYEFMAKIVEMYEKSKESALLPTSPEEEQVPEDVRRQNAFELIEQALQGVIPSDQFEITEQPDGTKHYRILNDGEGKEVVIEEKLEIIWPSEPAEPVAVEKDEKPAEAEGAEKGEQPTEAEGGEKDENPTETEGGEKEEKPTEAEGDEKDEKPPEPEIDAEIPKPINKEEDTKKVVDMVVKIHKRELSPSHYTETDNIDGTKTYFLNLGDKTLEVLNKADIISSKKSVQKPSPELPAEDKEKDKVAKDTQEGAGMTFESKAEESIMYVPDSQKPTLPTIIAPDFESMESGEYDRERSPGPPTFTWESTKETDIPTSPAIKGMKMPDEEPQPTEQPLPIVQPLPTEQPPPPQPPMGAIGDAQGVVGSTQIDCECGKVHDGGAAPPLLSLGEKKLTLEFKLGGPSTVQKVVEGLRVKATISGTNACAQKDKSIVVSFDVSGDQQQQPPKCETCDNNCDQTVCDCASDTASVVLSDKKSKDEGCQVNAKKPKGTQSTSEPCSCSDNTDEKDYDSDSILKSMECPCDIPKMDDETCSCDSTTLTWSDAAENLKKSETCICVDSKPAKDQQLREKTANKKCGPECKAPANRKKITPIMCQALKDFIERSKNKENICKCGNTHSSSCLTQAKKDYVDNKCTSKKPMESQATSAPKICENSVQKVVDCLKQQNFKDPAQLERHIKGLQPLLKQMEGISMQSFQCSAPSPPKCVCVSSVQVIYKKSDEMKNKATCTNIREKYKPPPPIQPLCKVPQKACNCDLLYGGDRIKDTTPLYQQEEEYKEEYYDETEDRKPSTKGISSLPDVLNETNKCKDKTEMPWLKMTLPPPGTFKITKQPKSLCDCKMKKKADTLDRIIGTCVCPEENKMKAEEVPCTCQVTNLPADPKMRCYCRGPDGKPRLPTFPCTCGHPTTKTVSSEKAVDGVKSQKPDPTKKPVKSTESPVKSQPPQGHDVTCPCRKPPGPCPELKRINLLYDDSNYPVNEEYMNPLYKMFPDEVEKPCGDKTEIEWSDYTLPTNVKLGGNNKKGRTVGPATWDKATNDSQVARSSGQSRGLLKPKSEMQQESKPEMQLAPKSEMQQAPKSDVQVESQEEIEEISTSKQTQVEGGTVELELKFSGYTEIISTFMSVDGGAQDQQTLSQFSTVSDVTKVLKRMDPNFVNTMLADRQYGGMPAIGSGEFQVLDDPNANALVPFTGPPQASSIPQIPERESDFMNLVSYEPSGRPSGRTQVAAQMARGNLPRGQPANTITVTREQKQYRVKATSVTPSGVPTESFPFDALPPIEQTKQSSVQVETYTFPKETREFGTSSDRNVAIRRRPQLQAPYEQSAFGVAEFPPTDSSEGPMQETICIQGETIPVPTSQSKPAVQKSSAASTLTESECSLNRLASPIIAALSTVEREMKPLRDTLNELRAKIQSMDIPELDNWKETKTCSKCQKQRYDDVPKEARLSTSADYKPISDPLQEDQKPLATKCICLETVDEEYGPRGMKEVVDETMALDKIVKHNLKTNSSKNEGSYLNMNEDMKDYKKVVERTMALDKLIRQNEMKTRDAQSAPNVKYDYRSNIDVPRRQCNREYSGDKTNLQKVVHSAAVNVSMGYDMNPNVYSCYPVMMDWFFQSMYNPFMYSHYYPEYTYGCSQGHLNYYKNIKRKSSPRKKSASESSVATTYKSYSSKTSSYTKTITSETTSYPTTNLGESTDNQYSSSEDYEDTEDGPNFQVSLTKDGPVFKAREGMRAMISKEGKRGLKITLKTTSSGKSVSSKEVCSSTST